MQKNQETSLPYLDESCTAAYKRLETLRQPYLDRARDCAKLTIPRLMPESGANGSTDFPTPFQSTGPRGVNNLSAKLLLALLPPNIPFFKFRIEPYAKEIAQASKAGGRDPQAEIEKNLVKAELAVQAELESSGLRVVAHEALQQLIVAGNVLLYMPDGETKMRVYRLDQYVVERDPMGTPIQIITCEKVSWVMLPDSVVAELSKLRNRSTPNDPMPTYDVYTRAQFDGKMWHVCQEVENISIPDTTGKFAPEDFPYIPLRGYNSSGEHYSRSFTDDYLGDLISLEGLAQAIVEYSAACANVKFLVKPAGLTDKDELAKLPNGGYGDGTAEDVTVVGIDKFADFRVAADTASQLKTGLSLAFLLNTGVQRPGERVTAEEIRFMAEELETTLGGTYSLLSLEFQLPLVNLLVRRMTAAQKLPKLPKKIIKPAIVTGIEALGRGNDLMRLRESAAAIAGAIGPGELSKFVNAFELAKRMFTASGIRSEGLIVDPAEAQQGAQQAQLMELVQKLGPEVIRQLGAQQAQGQAAAPAPQA